MLLMRKLIKLLGILFVAVFVGVALPPLANAEVIQVPPGNRNDKRPKLAFLSVLWTAANKGSYEAKYRQIYGATRLTRGELAALISVKVTALSRLQPGPTRVAVDISGSWAREHIIKLLALDVLEVYPNHTFQPAATVRRGDLARAVGQLLELLGWKPPASPALADMSPHNLFYDGAARAVAAGLMSLTPAGAFEPWRPVSGADAAAVLDGLVRLVGP